MLDGTNPYQIHFIQKASPKKGDAFDFSYIYKFYTDRTKLCQRLKYIIRVEAHESVFAIKFYASRDKKMDNKYNRIIKAHSYREALRIFVTCAYIVPEILKKHPRASFAINGAQSIDLYSNKIEDENNNQRFRIYKSLCERLFSQDKFEHFEFEEISSYLMINKCTGNIFKQRDKIKDMFVERYDIELSPLSPDFSVPI